MSAQADLLEAGTELAGYRVERLLGRGGMGLVYLASDTRLKRHVAVKLVAPELSLDPDFRRRFQTESELAASLEHPNVVPVYDAREADGQLLIAMRYVQGTDLRQLLAAEGPLAPARAIAICQQVADALDAAHARGLVHRDVKPSNVLLDEQDRAYLTDFGLSAQISEQRVRDGRSLGTAAYAAPEQIKGGSADAGADVYALGCLLFECLAGEPPYRGDRELALLWAHLEQPPPAISERHTVLPQALDEVLGKALAKDPGERYETCGELVRAAQEALGLRQPRTGGTRVPLLAGALVVVLALAAALTGILLTQGAADTRPPLGPVTDSTLVRLNPQTGKVAAVVEVGRGTKAVAVGGDTVWVYNVTEGTLTAIDARTNEILRVSRVATTPAESAFYNGPLLAADRNGAWVVGSRDDQGVLTRARLRSDVHLEHPLVSAPEVGDPVAVAVGMGSVWVLTRHALLSTRRIDDELLRIDPATGAIQGRIRFSGVPGGGGAVYGLAVGAGAVWAVNAENAELFRVDPGSLAVTGKADLGLAGSVPAAGYGSVWAVRDWASNVLRVQPTTLAVTRAGTARHELVDVALGGGSLWANGFTSGIVYRIEPRTGRTVSTVRLTSDDTRAPAQGSAASPSIAAGAGGVWVTVSPAR